MGGIVEGAAAVGGLASAAGTLMGGNAQANALRAQGPADLLAAVYGAQQAKMNADESRAASQRQAMDIGMQQKQAESKLQAGAAMGGGDTTDSGVQALDAGLKDVGEYHQLMAMYNGESRARGWEDQAKNIATSGVNRFNADNYKADTIQRQLPFSAAGTLMSSVASPFKKYGEFVKDRRYTVG